MENTTDAGLTEGGVYYIENAANNQFVNVRGQQTTNGTDVINYDFEDGKFWNEKWQVTTHGDGKGLKIKATCNGDQVLDERQNNHTTCLYGSHGGVNQHWVLVPAAYTITNVQTGRALRGAGHGNTITTVPQNKNDKNTWWTFNKTGSVDLGAPAAPPTPTVIHESGGVQYVTVIQDPPEIVYEYVPYEDSEVPS